MKRFGCVTILLLWALGVPITMAQTKQKRLFPPDEDGFIQDWLLLDSIQLSNIHHAKEGIQAIVTRASFKDLVKAKPKAGDTVTIDGTPLKWRAQHVDGYVVDLTGYAAKLKQPVVNVVFWGVCYIQVKEDMKDVRLAIGSDDSSVWWLNGKQVIGAYGVRQTATDDNVSKRLILHRGMNVLRFAVIQGDGPGDCCARFYDAHQRPLTDLLVSLGSVKK